MTMVRTFAPLLVESIAGEKAATVAALSEKAAAAAGQEMHWNS